MKPNSRAFRSVISDDLINYMAKDNMQRIKEAIEEMGSQYVCHKTNFIKPILERK